MLEKILEFYDFKEKSLRSPRFNCAAAASSNAGASSRMG